MKKFISMALVSIMIITSGCAGQNERNGNETENGNSQYSNLTNLPDLSEDVVGEITVRAYETYAYLNFLETAAQAFEEKFPGTKVNIETFSAMPEIKTMETEDGGVMSIAMAEDDSSGRNDYLLQLNTELMSGRGPDIIAMDVVPFYKYAEMGFLENLETYINSDDDFKNENYWMNVIEGARYKGGIYLLPTSITYTLMEYNTKLIEEGIIPQKDYYNFMEVYEFLKESFTPDEMNKMMAFYGASDAFKSMFMLDFNHYVDLENRRANFTDGSFVKLLEFSKMLEDEGYINKPIDFNNFDSMVTLSTLESSSVVSEFFSMMLSQLFIPESNQMIFFGSSMNDTNEILGSIGNSTGDIPYSFVHSFGINSNSENKRTAWEFIKFLLSYEMQMSTSLFGSLINREATRDKAALEITGKLYEEDRTGYPTELNEEEQQALDQYLNASELYMGKLNKLVILDYTALEMIDSEVDMFLSGERTAEETAQRIQSRVELYLNE